MDVEESIRANPIDGVVLLVGCDKTTPALLMGAASCDLPTIVVSGGPMLNGKFRGEDIGSGTDVWQFTETKTGEMTEADLIEAESCMSRSAGPLHDDGHRVDDGVDGRIARHRAADERGDSRGRFAPQGARAHGGPAHRRRWSTRICTMSKILTREAFENAILVNGAIGGSTNAVVHLLAIAGRLGVPLTLDDWDKLGRDVPCVVNLMPSGQFLMEDFYYAGGLAGRDPRDRRVAAQGRADGQRAHDLGEFEGRVNYNAKVITPVATPFKRQGGIAVLRGNLAPDGAVLKPSAATPALMKHRGRAVVFENIEDLHRRIDDEALDVNPDDILVLKNCGPKGYPGFPEVGNIALPAKMLKQGVTDMVRISDARMSGTAYGTVVLHAAPEAAAGGPLALVRRRRHDRARCRRAPPASASLRRGARASPREVATAAAAFESRLGQALLSKRCSRPTRAWTSIFSSATQERRSDARVIEPNVAHYWGGWIGAFRLSDWTFTVGSIGKEVTMQFYCVV